MRIRHALRHQATRIVLSLLMLATLLGVTPAASASAGNNNIKIIAWYGAGNLSKSEYGRDTVILFNPTQAPITMNNWSLQTGGTTGAFSAVTYKLPVATIPAGGFYAIAGSGTGYISSSGCVSSHCNLNYAYDYQLKTIEETAAGTQAALTTDNDLSSTAVTVALVSNQTALGTCPTNSANLVDLIGIGAADGTAPVTCFAGSSYATYTPSTTNGVATNINGIVYAYATVRKNKCGDTFNNANDFYLGFIDFYNSSSAAQPCPLGTQLAVTATATPNNPGILDPFKLTAAVTPSTLPSSTGLNVTADLSNLGLSATTPLYDDGTHGDSIAGDHIFSLSTQATTGTLGTVPGLIVTATDTQGSTARNLVPLSLSAGTISMTTPSTTGTIQSGGVLTFPITLTGVHGYGGILNMTCTGSPNTNSLGVPISTQCVSTPPEVTLANNGTATLSLAIATGTTYSARMGGTSLPLALIGLFSIVLLTVGVVQRKRLPSCALLALLTFATLSATACGTNAGMGNTGAAPGVYTYTLTATDSTVATLTNSLTFTITVQ